jgi:hypothetical protein
VQQLDPAAEAVLDVTEDNEVELSQLEASSRPGAIDGDVL